MTVELEATVAHVLELAVHLKRGAEVAPSDTAAVAEDVALCHTQRINRSHRNAIH